MHQALTASVIVTTTAVGCYLYRLNSSISTISASDVIVTDSSPASLLESRSYCSVVNPRGHIGRHDTRTIVVTLPASKAHCSDEQILASFVKGFFGGWVFTPERLLFQFLRPSLVQFSRTWISQNPPVHAQCGSGSKSKGR